MNVLLVGINAKFIHSNLAIRYLQKYCTYYKDNIETVEYTINNHYDFILQEIYKKKPDILTISCYIWNIEIVKSLVKDYKKISPDTLIVLGGPEVSYDTVDLMNEYKEIDIVVVGEGEATFNDLMKYYIDGEGNLDSTSGIIYRKGKELLVNEYRIPLGLDDIPFVYDNGFSEFQNKIIYYESSRGCPFNCQYCLSSIEKGVRLRSLSLVLKELQCFLDARVVQVKFVDRTFNCNKKHALGIWKYLYEHDNGFTNFHFEISGDLLDDETIEFLSKVRPGLFQLEVGVQSTNETTINNIKRKTNFERLSGVVSKINQGNNIHQHLDLIAGLPGEDYNSFGRSFNDVYKLEPQQLQLGFLKVLKGSGLKQDVGKYGIIYKDKAPYEVLKTKELSYDDVLKLKMIEEMVEIYYNSGNFYFAIKYMERYFSDPFDLYEKLARYWLRNKYHEINHNKIKLYTILLEFYYDEVEKDDDNIKEILKFDMYLQEKVKKYPYWLERSNDFREDIIEFYKDENNILKFLPDYSNYTSKQISRMTHLEIFPINIIKWSHDFDQPIKNDETAVLFDYHNRDVFRNNAKYVQVKL
ncbi:B12-binding domain-containing radical SAM protein [Vallitalea longa]|uniref:B12-binding domain-containing radical SAM protein n=1 Tax=Vallitalea longa TaxID=2936439 RepID=A0A9W5YIS5_9FIRM|nr:B12-binding domain-containing radical SAM protein [Vallitalea longa]GKX32083.1 B12-binding domain-containing radical SAM protein [Vallitalea longa]